MSTGAVSNSDRAPAAAGAAARRYYNGPWSPGPTPNAKKLDAFRMFSEGFMPTDYWRIPNPNLSVHADIFGQYRAGMLTVKRSVYVKRADYDNPAHWSS